MIELERKLKEYPTLAKVPVAVVHGRAVTAEELLELVKRGDPEAVRAARRLGLDPTPEETKLLAKEFWRRLPPNVKVFVLGVGYLTKDEILRAIDLDTPLGKKLVRAYERLLREYGLA